jgi:ABC-type phosphonate transport system ATPase subunit
MKPGEVARIVRESIEDSTTELETCSTPIVVDEAHAAFELIDKAGNKFDVLVIRVN